MSKFNNPFFFFFPFETKFLVLSNFFVFSVEENDHLKAENRSLKKDLLTAIENGASGNKNVSLKGGFS